MSLRLFSLAWSLLVCGVPGARHFGSINTGRWLRSRGVGLALCMRASWLSKPLSACSIARVRDYARELARMVKELLVIIAATTSVVVIGFAVAICAVPSFVSVAPLMWMFLVGTLMLSYGVEWFYRGIERYSYIAVRSLAFKILTFVATLLSIRRPGDYLVYGAILAFVTCGNNLFNLIRLHKPLDLKSVGKLGVRRHIRPLMVFGARAIGVSRVQQHDVWRVVAWELPGWAASARGEDRICAMQCGRCGDGGSDGKVGVARLPGTGRDPSPSAS